MFSLLRLLLGTMLFLLMAMLTNCALFKIPTSRQATTPPLLILISGCTGTGKSTFGMEVAISLGILKCISTDTVRQVMRPFNEFSPALHRSSYAGDADPVKQWLECCSAVEKGVNSMVDDSIKRGTSMVLEGVHVVPGDALLQRWTSKGGVAVGCVLTIPDAEVHRAVIERRGEILRKGATGQLKSIPRIRAIHDEMHRLGQLHGWTIIEQKPRLEPKPIDLISSAIGRKLNEHENEQEIPV